MWTSLINGFLYIYTGMVAGVTGSILTDTNQISGSTNDWILPASALIQRAQATYYATNTFTTTNALVVRITWEDNTLTYNSYSNTNTTAHAYLYGKQLYTTFSRWDEPNGFDVVATSTAFYKMANYYVSPLLWGGDAYTPSALTNTVPTVLTPFRVADQEGRYIYNFTTNAWPYYYTNIYTNVSTNIPPVTEVVTQVVYISATTTNEGTNVVIVVPTNFVGGNGVTNPIDFAWTTTRVDKVFLDYNPTNQRPNAITPLMGKSHVDAIDAKFVELIPKYYDNSKSDGDTFDSYCATAGVYWVSNYYVGAIWFDEENILSTTTQTWSYTPTFPKLEISSIITSAAAGTPEHYDWSTNIPIEVAGTAEDYDRLTTTPGTSITPVPGWASHMVSGGGSWGTHTVSGEVAGTEGDHTRETHVTNIVASGGSTGSSNDYNAVKSSTTEKPAGTFSSTVISWTGVEGVGIDGEIDYYYDEIEISEAVYTNQMTTNASNCRKVYLDTSPGSASWYTYTTLSNHTDAGTASHYNRTTEDREWQNTRTYIWGGVSNILADYMVPWKIDHTNAPIRINHTNYLDKFLYNLGWSPSYSNDWRLWKEEIVEVSASTNYFWDYVTTNYFHENYEYWLKVWDDSNPSWYYPRSYSYYWKYPTEVIDSYYKQGSWEEPQWNPGMYEEWYGNYTNYYKTVDNYHYYLTVITTNWCIKEPLFRVNYQVYPTPPPIWVLTNFMAAHSNMLNPNYLGETQTVISSNIVVSTNSSGNWTNYVTTNTIITYPAKYTNAMGWSVSMWAGSMQDKYKAITSLVWTAYGGTMESKTRTLSTTNVSGTGWSTAPITTNLSGGTYNCSIYTYYPVYYRPATYTFSKTVVRVRRLSPAPMDGVIDTYLKFGQTISGRYDLESIGYPLGPYVRVDELCVPEGDTYSEWLGDIDTPPTFPDLEDYMWHHPWGFTIQNSGSAPTYVFKPAFGD